MKITSRLMEERKTCAADGVPAAFSLVSLLDDVSELDRIIATSDHKLSLPAPVGDVDQSSPDEGAKCDNNGAAALFSALEKPAKQEEKSKAQYRKMLEVNRRMKASFMKKKISGEKSKFDQIRESLPAWAERDKIVSLLSGHQVIVISGMTGCGKSTQVT